MGGWNTTLKFLGLGVSDAELGPNPQSPKQPTVLIVRTAIIVLHRMEALTHFTVGDSSVACLSERLGSNYYNTTLQYRKITGGKKE